MVEETEQTGAVINFINHTSGPLPDVTYTVHISSAQTGFQGYSFSDTIVYNSNGDHYTITINYLKALYSGGNLAPGDMPHSLKLHSDLNVKCDGHSLQSGILTDALETLEYKGALTNTQGLYSINYQPKNRATHKFHKKNVNIAFKRPDNTLADVEDFAIQIAVVEDKTLL